MLSPGKMRTILCSNGLSHVIKMAAMPKYGKTLNKFFSRTTGPIILKLGMWHQVTKEYKVCSNDDPRLTLTYLQQGKI